MLKRKTHESSTTYVDPGNIAAQILGYDPRQQSVKAKKTESTPMPPPPPAPPQKISLDTSTLDNVITYFSQPMNSAYIIIIAHGSVNPDKEIVLSETIPKVKTFQKKNESACGFLSMSHVTNSYSAEQILNDVLKKGLESSFPRIEDVRRMRKLYHDYPPPQITREDSLRHLGNEDMSGDCSTGVCETLSNPVVIYSKQYSPASYSPASYSPASYSPTSLSPTSLSPILLLFGSKLYNLFSIASVSELFNYIPDMSLRGQELYALFENRLTVANERKKLVTTTMIFHLIDLLNIENVYILDLSCSGKHGHLTTGARSLIHRPTGTAYGRKQKTKYRRNKYKNKTNKRK
jgi:hypothetical protein